MDSFTYKANDGIADSNIATVTITVNPVNDPPVATNDSYSVNQDAVLTVAVSGVLSNDIDIDGNVLTAIKVTDPAHGTLSLNTGGSFVYTPTASFNGVDSFTYKANDGLASSNIATVTVTVNPVNEPVNEPVDDPPVAIDDNYSVYQDAVLTVGAPGVLDNDISISRALLTTIKVTDPAHGTLTLNADGSFVYIPTANFNGVDSFTYKANSGSANSNVATVTITINPPGVVTFLPLVAQ